MRKFKNCFFWCFFTIFNLLCFFMVIMRIDFIYAYLLLFTLEGITYLLIVLLMDTFCLQVQQVRKNFQSLFYLPL